MADNSTIFAIVGVGISIVSIGFVLAVTLTLQSEMRQFGSQLDANQRVLDDQKTSLSEAKSQLKNASEQLAYQTEQLKYLNASLSTQTSNLTSISKQVDMLTNRIVTIEHKLQQPLCNSLQGCIVPPTTLTRNPIPPTPVLVAHWPMDEGSGTVVRDTTPNGINGIVNKASWTNGPDCRSSSCLLFNPINGDNYVEIPQNTSSVLNLSEFTLSAWINVHDPTENYQMIINKRPFPPSDYGTNYALALSANLNLIAYFGDGSGLHRVEGSIDLATHQWYFVVATYNGTNLTIYVNGTLDKTLSAHATPAVSDANIYIGTYGSGKTTQCENPAAFDPKTEVPEEICTPFGGVISDVSIYNGAMTPSQISGLSVSSLDAASRSSGFQ